ncbi:MAG: hypothetical protein JWM81_1161 [Candidatus Saccharibacteria bacterium]|nr:hypothetical protein [Candidatus Saccharibacteria bacterium]
MSEKLRTVLLLLLLLLAIGFIFWMQQQYANNFVDAI